MITEQDLQAAIAECQGERHPNANTCIKLAAFLTIRREMFGDSQPVGNPDTLTAYSFAPPPEPVTVEVEAPIKDYTATKDGDIEFAEAITGKTADDVIPVMVELMAALRVTNRKLYNAVMQEFV